MNIVNLKFVILHEQFNDIYFLNNQITIMKNFKHKFEKYRLKILNYIKQNYNIVSIIVNRYYVINRLSQKSIYIILILSTYKSLLSKTSKSI